MVECIHSLGSHGADLSVCGGGVGGMHKHFCTFSHGDNCPVMFCSGNAAV